MEDLEILIRIRKTLGFEKKNMHAFAKSLGYCKLSSYQYIETGIFPLNNKLKQRLSALYRVNPEYLNTGQGEMFLKDGENIFISEKYEIYDRLFQLRTQLNLSQVELANKLDWSRNMYALLEINRAVLSQNQSDILRQMGVNIPWLLTGKGEMLTSIVEIPTTIEEIPVKIDEIPANIENIQESGNQDIGERLRLFRKYLKLSRPKMCLELGIKSIFLLDYIENGFQNIKPETIKQLEISFDINTDWLLNGNGNMFKISKLHKNA